MEQINTTRRAILKTNEIFDYDKPGKTEDVKFERIVRWIPQTKCKSKFF